MRELTHGHTGQTDSAGAGGCGASVAPLCAAFCSPVPPLFHYLHDLSVAEGVGPRTARATEEADCREEAAGCTSQAKTALMIHSRNLDSGSPEQTWLLMTACVCWGCRAGIYSGDRFRAGGYRPPAYGG